MKIDFEIFKKTKDNDAIFAQNFVYNYKVTNKDGSNHYVCNRANCYSSLTVQNETICKVNGKLILNQDLALSHSKHVAFKDEEIIGMNFVKILKSRIEKENSKSAAELYKEEQSKLIEELGDMELVAKSLPQLVEISSGLYKHKSKFVPLVPKTIDKIKIEGEYKMCEDKVRQFVFLKLLNN
jgi:hypothetical protein